MVETKPAEDGPQNAPAKEESAGGVLARIRQSLQTPSPGANDCLTYEELQNLRQRVRSNDEITNEIAEELSAALQQAERIRSRNLYVAGANDRLTFIIDCLLAKKPQLVLARDERLSLQIEIYRQRGPLSRALAAISAGSPVGLVLAALAIAFVLWIVIMVIISAFSHIIGSRLAGGGGDNIITRIFFMNGTALTVITAAAIIGGIVSIATRLNEFSRVRDLDPFAMFWTAMLKPLIGAVLAIFILATLAGKILTLGFLSTDALFFSPNDPDLQKQIAAKEALYVLWALGFIAGFSERFAWDFVARTEGIAGGKPGATKADQTTRATIKTD